MNTYTKGVGLGDWVYVKLYLGQAIDRMDHLIVKLGEAVPRLQNVGAWFYIRYFDEDGIHLRLRARAVRGAETQVREDLGRLCSQSLNNLHELLPSSYYPMVVPVGFDQARLAARAGGGAHNDTRIVSDQYEPEHDKYGGAVGVRFAEEVFEASSDIATAILADETRGLYSRKDLVPRLMSEAVQAFRPANEDAGFWREYSYYRRGGHTPAADDRREKFLRKGRELDEQGVAVVAEPAALHPTARAHVEHWKHALAEAQARYAEMHEVTQASNEVLAFNFAHLMNNRLGITSLEESYMATLLEQRARRLAPTEAAR
jgi:thiopeptide-type bacteriocin biosynthesis protein